MTSTLLLLDLLGSAALLLWGLGLLKSGVTSAFGAQLRLFIARSTRNRILAFGAGLLTTLALQSSTGIALMVSSFTAQGLMGGAMAQAVMLGANVGTAVVTQVLALDLHWLAPVAILGGVLSNSGKSRRAKGLGGIAIGLGLMLLALSLMNEATAPMRHSPAVASFFALLGNAPIVAVAIAVAMAAVSASSLAVVLFVLALAKAGSIDPTLCLLLVAGANLGGALPPLLAATAENISGRRVALSNLVVRGTGALVVLFLSGWLAPWLAGRDLARLTIEAHLGFNVVLALVFLPIVGPLDRLMHRVLPDRAIKIDTGPRHLDEAALADPPAALASATRETLRVGDVVQTMLETCLEAMKTNDELLCQSLFKFDDQVDALEEAVKLYLARVKQTDLDEATLRQISVVLDYATNLEHVGDVIERSLARLTLKKIEKQLQYSPDGMAEIESLFLDIIENLQVAQRVFLSRDAQMARRLMESKVAIRRKERESAAHHMVRLQQGRPDTLLTTSLHLDVLRDLKRINAHIVSVANPILEDAGLLRESRLRKV